MDRARAHVRVSGRVQGVFFRVSAAERARALGLSGWVRNDPDGAVSAAFQGPRAAVEEAIDWCSRGPAHAAVSGVEVAWADLEDDETDFRISG